MQYLVSYDVKKDKERTKIMKFLKDCGYHLQKSVFVVNCEDRAKAKKIYDKIIEHSDVKCDRILMTPICSSCFKRKWLSGPGGEFQETIWIL